MQPATILQLSSIIVNYDSSRFSNRLQTNNGQMAARADTYIKMMETLMETYTFEDIEYIT